MIKFFAAGVAALLSLVSVDCFAGGQPIHKGDLIYECPVSGGRASGSRNEFFNGKVPIYHGRTGSVTYVYINSGILGVHSHAPFEGRTSYYDKLSGTYKVAIMDKLGHPTFTDEYYNGVINCVNGIPPTPEEA